MKKNLRKCPCCNNNSIDITELYTGAVCFKCGKTIEVIPTPLIY